MTQLLTSTKGRLGLSTYYGTCSACGAIIYRVATAGQSSYDSVCDAVIVVSEDGKIVSRCSARVTLTEQPDTTV